MNDRITAEQVGLNDRDMPIYRLSEEVMHRGVWGDEIIYDHILVSDGINAIETYVFPCNANGHVIDWLELPGSIRGRYDQSGALAGYLEWVSAEVHRSC